MQFDIEATFDLATSSRDISYTGPAAAVLNLISPEEFSLEVSTAGLYIITAEVTDAESNVYSDSYAILAMDQTVLDNLLQGKWEGMRGALAAGNISAAANFFISDRKSSYETVFTDVLTQVLAVIPEDPIEFVSVEDGRGEYVIDYEIEVNGAPMTVSSYVIFMIDYNGLWKISFF